MVEVILQAWNCKVDPPEGVQAAFLALADDLWEHPFRAFGFPAGQDDGVWTTGRLLDKQATNWVMIEDVKEQGFPVARGFSGTPIWDVQLQGVVGMVVAAEGRAEIKAAYAIPVDVLLAAWPMLEARLLPRVFISSAPADAAFAARLKTDLQNRGVFAISPDHERAVHQAIRYANAMLLVASPHTRSSRIVKEHLRIAGMYRRHVVFLWVAGEEVIQALPLVASKAALIDARPSRYETALDEITRSLDEEMLTPTQVLSLLEPVGEPRNPYKGLRAFTQKDVGDFFGRDALVHDLVESVKEVTTETAGIPAARLLTIIGPSGSGKSSVAMAGLLPRLQQGALPDSEKWIYLEPIVPGKRPVEALLLTLAPMFPDHSLKTIRDDLEDDSARGLHLLAVQMTKQRGGSLVLLIDHLKNYSPRRSRKKNGSASLTS